eukprot:9357130-Karenia_brevis.AAC.1
MVLLRPRGLCSTSVNSIVSRMGKGRGSASKAKAALVEQLETETRRYSRLAVRDGNPLTPPTDGTP